MFFSDFTPARSGYLYVALALNKHDIPLEKGVSTITSTYLYDLTFKMIVAILGAYFIYAYIFADRLSYAIVITFLLILGVITAGILLLYAPRTNQEIFSKKGVFKKDSAF
ncbi:MAG: lysylphosphatidylglycerol synthase domain-containing protein [Ignavibacteriales bacterium]|nr:lysylphosphatidylglycerol synthase domain-containing protein [Ignavibacteriales bacterium]